MTALIGLDGYEHCNSGVAVIAVDGMVSRQLCAQRWAVSKADVCFDDGVDTTMMYD